jgi:hypothetical protein
MNNQDWLQRESELDEINELAISLKYIDGDDRTVYEALLGAYFPHATTARDLKDHERIQWLTMLRLWQQGDGIRARMEAALEAELAERRTA